MTLRQFIKDNRSELKEVIEKSINFVPKQASCRCPKNGTDHYHNDTNKLDTEELRLWILNDESLYNWARREGVRI